LLQLSTVHDTPSSQVFVEFSHDPVEVLQVDVVQMSDGQMTGVLIHPVVEQESIVHGLLSLQRY